MPISGNLLGEKVPVLSLVPTDDAGGLLASAVSARCITDAGSDNFLWMLPTAPDPAKPCIRASGSGAASAEPEVFAGTVGSGGEKVPVRGNKTAPAVSGAAARGPPQDNSGPVTASLPLRETTPEAPPTEGERGMTGKSPCPDAAPADGAPFGGGKRVEEAAAAWETAPEGVVIDKDDRLSIAGPERSTSGAAKGKGNGGIAAPEEEFGRRAKMVSARDAPPTLRWIVAVAVDVGFTKGREDADGSALSWTTAVFGDVETPSRCCFRKGGRTKGAATTAGFTAGILSALPTALSPDAISLEALRCEVLPIASFALANGLLSPAVRGIF